MKKKIYAIVQLEKYLRTNLHMTTIYVLFDIIHKIL